MEAETNVNPARAFMGARATWILVALLPLLLAWKSYPLWQGVDVQQLWTKWDYISSYCQDIVLWGVLAFAWSSGLWRRGRWTIFAFIAISNMVLLVQMFDARLKLLFLQPLSLGLIDFGVDEFGYLSTQTSLFLGNRYWKGALFTIVALNAAGLIPLILGRVLPRVARTCQPALLSPTLVVISMLGIVGMINTVPKAYGLHKNFFVDVVSGFLEGPVPGLYDHDSRPTSEPARTLAAGDYRHTT